MLDMVAWKGWAGFWVRCGKGLSFVFAFGLVLIDG